MKALLSAAFLLVATGAASDSFIVPQVKFGPPVVATYHCPTGKPFTVTYWNGDNGQSFALMPIAGKPTLLVNTLSADGVRYAAGSIVWWTKGSIADLYDARVDPEKPMLAGCRSR
jgi:membrane-bound inhibitor of C-type lysozyme